MSKAIIVTGYLDSPHLLNTDLPEKAFVICADKGLLIARELGLRPDLLIGDYDSMAEPQDQDVIKLPTVKDMTDTEAAIDLAISRGFTDLTVVGGLGGRFDHTMGNIGVLKKYLEKPVSICLVDGQNKVCLKAPGCFAVAPEIYRYLGLIAYDSPCTKLCVSGTRYPLRDHTLTNDTSLGVSNEILEEHAHISFTSGTLLVILSRDRG